MTGRKNRAQDVKIEARTSKSTPGHQNQCQDVKIDAHASEERGGPDPPLALPPRHAYAHSTYTGNAAVARRRALAAASGKYPHVRFIAFARKNDDVAWPVS